MPTGDMRLRRKVVTVNPTSKAEEPRENSRGLSQPLAPPPFGVREIRAAIPAHCFKRDMVKGFYHVAVDLAKAAVLAYAATYISHPALPAWAPYLLWPVYWVLQGLVWTGLWVLAHEAGHQVRVRALYAWHGMARRVVCVCVCAWSVWWPCVAVCGRV